MSEISWIEKFSAAQKEVSLEDYRGRRGNILVIAPHPDDDVLGAGGTMAMASSQGRGVFSVYITDGRGSPRKDQTISDDEMAARRQEEAVSALQAVGAVGGIFLKMRSAQLEKENERKAEKELAEILHFIRPEEVFLPAPYERHRTHQRSTHLSVEALRQAAPLKTILLGYSLWGSFWGGKRRVVRDITPFIRKKLGAVMAHGSQILYKNYQQGILGKNNSEAIFWESHEPPQGNFLEIFLDMTELLEKRDLTLEAFMRQDLDAFIQAFL